MVKTSRVSTTEDLGQISLWGSTRVTVVIPNADGNGSQLEEADAPAVRYIAGPPSDVSYSYFVIMSDVRHTMTYVTRFGHWYVYLGDDVTAYNLGPGEILFDGSYFKMVSPSEGNALVASRFAGQIGIDTLRRQPQRLSYGREVPREFVWPEGLSVPVVPRFVGATMAQGILEVELVNDRTRSRATLWIELATHTIVRSVVDGREYYRMR